MSTDKKAPARPRRRRRKKGSGRFKAAMLLFLIPMILGIALGGFMAFARTVPSIDELKDEVIPPGTKIYADDDSLVGEMKIVKGQYMPIARLPKHLIDAVVAVEDSHYWEHSGIDYLAIMRAAIKDILKRHLKEGGSTITQQLAKNTFLTSEKTFRRKIKELILAQRIEENLSKEEILELYLNRAYFGEGAYGVEMAAKTYFGKSVTEIGIHESAIIAGLLKAPSAYSPKNDFEKAKARQELVLKRMEEEGYITREERLNAMKSAIYLVNPEPRVLANNYFVDYVKSYLNEHYSEDMLYKGGLSVYTTLDPAAQEAAMKAVQQGLRDADKRRGFRGPIDHIDPATIGERPHRASFKRVVPKVGDILEGVVLEVKGAEAIIQAEDLRGTLKKLDADWARKSLDEATQKHKWVQNFDLAKILSPGDVVLVGIKSIDAAGISFTLEQEPLVQGALVSMESYTGYVRSLVGGYDFLKSQYNRAVYANRQPGSAFKPIIFALAIKRGLTPATVINDVETTYDKETEEKDEAAPTTRAAQSKENVPLKSWTPKNYDDEYHGPTRLREALAHSRNVVTVKLVDIVGIDRVIKFANTMGITSNMPRDLTIALGSMSVTPISLTSSYSAFANKGVMMKPIVIKYITDRGGRVIESFEPEGTRVLDEQTTFLMTSMLQDVVNIGTGWRARALNRPVAGKTGTTNDYRDAWFLGYTPDIVTGVWVGFDDPRPLGPEETGSRSAAPIWVDYMQSVLATVPPSDFPKPPGIVTKRIDPATGLLANEWTDNAMTEYFKKGTEPKEETYSIWNTTEPDNILFK